jgi:DDE family transposase/SWIM zinc finger
MLALPAPTVSVSAAAPSIDPNEARRLRGQVIADLARIECKSGQWVVPSQKGKGRYYVDAEQPRCTCPDFDERGQPCKHIWAVRYVIERRSHPDGSESVTETLTIAKRAVAPRPTYRQDWPAYNAAQIHEKEKFQTLMTDLVRGVPEPPANPKGGRTPVPTADRAFACALKVYTTISGRRASTDMRDAQDKGHLSQAPHYSSVSRYLEDPAMTKTLTGLIAESARPLRSVETDFAIDSSGFATSRFVRWFDHKYGVVKKEYDWVKVSVCTGKTTNVVTAVEIDERYAGDCPRFKPLLEATVAGGFRPREVSADSAYLSYENMELVASCGGTPYIAFKANSTAGDGGTMARMFHLYNFKRDEYLNHYHKRSNVESTFSMIKAKFGDSLRSKTDVAMRNEALCKILCHNVCCLIQSHYELGIEATFWGKEWEEPESPPAVPPVCDPVDFWAWV